MQKLKGQHCYLRALEMADLNFLYELENDSSIWEISGTVTPYSKHVLRKYLENAHRDIYDVKQLRLVICLAGGQVVGLIDLFDFDPKNRRAGIGIVIMKGDERDKGVGGEALTLLMHYAFSTLDVRQLYANVGVGNMAAVHLFKKLGFTQAGVKKDWIFSEGEFTDEILFQKIST
ncbi:GNAT family N-acetyltransferase [Aggregatimonas sangjinii]|uniref:GNAT family N-acetyltransferase n=1 Tax=Aggregatimonas sangjinii TaxID=2583587 RepID=A0A5B7STH9_9FLAO|nr:GNAT family N-acetyltransferase [Aggregatimonas sangjinii]QCX00288.1 GNAT family N-acetyltransferase [Aggregatimonas sangjinii]